MEKWMSKIYFKPTPNGQRRLVFEVHRLADHSDQHDGNWDWHEAHPTADLKQTGFEDNILGFLIDLCILLGEDQVF